MKFPWFKTASPDLVVKRACGCGCTRCGLSSRYDEHCQDSHCSATLFFANDPEGERAYWQREKEALRLKEINDAYWAEKMKAKK